MLRRKMIDWQIFRDNLKIPYVRNITYPRFVASGQKVGKVRAKPPQGTFSSFWKMKFVGTG